MGTPGAPGYSMSICIYSEKQWWDSIYDYQQHLIRLFRYFDDLRAVTVFKFTDIKTKNLCNKLIDKLVKQCYHPSLKVILEEFEQGTFKFLEATMTFKHKHFSSTYTVKNFKPLIEEGKLKFLTAQDFHSFTGQKEKLIRKATIRGKLSALMGYNFYDKDFIQSYGPNLAFFHALHYPKHLVIGELYKLFEKSKEKIWKLLAEFTELVYSKMKLEKPKENNYFEICHQSVQHRTCIYKESLLPG